MRRIIAVTLMAALMVAAVSAGVGGEISAGRQPDGIAAAGFDSVMYTGGSAYQLPSSVIAFTSSGDAFYVNFWGDWDGNGTYEWDTKSICVPGAMTLPRISQPQNRSGTFYTGWAFYCATDSVHVIAGDR